MSLAELINIQGCRQRWRLNGMVSTSGWRRADGRISSTGRTAGQYIPAAVLLAKQATPETSPRVLGREDRMIQKEGPLGDYE
jgi:hypothetical protein